MEIEYEAEVPEDIKEGVARLVRYVKEREIIQGNDRTQLIAYLLTLSLALEQPICGTVEVEPPELGED